MGTVPGTEAHPDPIRFRFCLPFPRCSRFRDSRCASDEESAQPHLIIAETGRLNDSSGLLA